MVEYLELDRDLVNLDLLLVSPFIITPMARASPKRDNDISIATYFSEGVNSPQAAMNIWVLIQLRHQKPKVAELFSMAIDLDRTITFLELLSD